MPVDFTMSQKQLLVPASVPGSAACTLCITGCRGTALPRTATSAAPYHGLLSYSSIASYTEQHIWENMDDTECRAIQDNYFNASNLDVINSPSCPYGAHSSPRLDCILKEGV